MVGLLSVVTPLLDMRPSEARTTLLDYCLASMARVWSKVQESERAEYKQYVEMGEILYHATDGVDGRCMRHDESCSGVEAYRRGGV